jgi:hypothetical protein
LTYVPAFDTLQAYTNYINARDYQTAYNMWLSPILDQPQPNGAPPEDYRRTFEDFSAGYANTQFVNIYMGEYLLGGAAAGKPYLEGMMPVVLIGQNTDGSFNAFAGCFVLGFRTTGELGIVNGQFYTLSNSVPSGTQIAQHLTIDCTQLAIPN